MAARFFSANGAINAVVPHDVPRSPNEAAYVDDFLHQWFDPGTGNSALPWYNWGQPWINTGQQFSVPVLVVPHATTRVPILYRNVWAGGYPYDAAQTISPAQNGAKDNELAYRLNQGVPIPSSVLNDRFYQWQTLNTPVVTITTNTQGGGGANEVQTITMTQTPTPTSGNWKIGFFGPSATDYQYTDRIAYNASAATIQAALRALPAIGSTGVTCTGGPINTTPVICTFGGPLANTNLQQLVEWAPGDSGLVIVDDTTNELWEMWEFAILPDSTIVVGYAGYMPDHTVNGGVFTDASSPTYQSSQWGSSATSISIAGAQISQQELIDGVIPHAIGMDLMGAADWWDFVWPAQRGDGQNWSPIPEGTRFRLDPALDPTAYNSTTPQATRTLRMLIVAMQNYGFIVWDKGGSIAIQVEPGSFDFMGGEWPNNLLHLMPLTAETVQVVDPSWRPGDIIPPPDTGPQRTMVPSFMPFPSAATMPANQVVAGPATVSPTGLQHTRGLDSPTFSPTGVRQLGALTVTVVRIYRLDGIVHVRTMGDPVARGRLTLRPDGQEHTRAQGGPAVSNIISPTGIVHTRATGAIEVNLRILTVPGLTRS